MPKATVTASTEAVATGIGRVAADQRDGWIDVAFVELRRSDVEHGRGEIDADHASGAGTCVDGGNRKVRGSGAEVENALGTGQPQRPNRALAPAPIDPRAQQMVEKVVLPGDRIEHTGDAVGRLRHIGHVFGHLNSTLKLSPRRTQRTRRHPVYGDSFVPVVFFVPSWQNVIAK